MDIRVLTNLVNEILRKLTSDEKTFTNSVVTTSGSVAAGASMVTMITSADYTGTILGATGTASTTYTFNPGSGNTISSLSYTITAGSIQIFKTI